MSRLSMGTCMSNLKSVALSVLNWSDWPVRCTQTHTQTHIERKQYLSHSLRDKNESSKAQNDGELTWFVADFSWQAVNKHLLLYIERSKVDPQHRATNYFLKVGLHKLSRTAVVGRRQPFHLQIQCIEVHRTEAASRTADNLITLTKGGSRISKKGKGRTMGSMEREPIMRVWRQSQG